MYVCEGVSWKKQESDNPKKEQIKKYNWNEKYCFFSTTKWVIQTRQIVLVYNGKYWENTRYFNNGFYIVDIIKLLIFSHQAFCLFRNNKKTLSTKAFLKN